MQILAGGAPCQQIDSEEDDDQEAEAEDEVSCTHITNDFEAVGTSKRGQQAAVLYLVFCDACVCVCVSVCVCVCACGFGAVELWSCTYQLLYHQIIFK